MCLKPDGDLRVPPDRLDPHELGANLSVEHGLHRRVPVVVAWEGLREEVSRFDVRHEVRPVQAVRDFVRRHPVVGVRLALGDDTSYQLRDLQVYLNPLIPVHQSKTTEHV